MIKKYIYVFARLVAFRYILERCAGHGYIRVTMLMQKKLPNFVRTRCEHVVGALFANQSFSDELILALVDLPL